MKLNEFIDFQLNNKTNVVTEESLEKTEIKNYFSGKKIEVGDSILIGILHEEDKSTGLPFTIVNFHKDELGKFYEMDENFTKNKIGMDLPILKRK